MRKVGVVTGSRAEYGLLFPVLKTIQAHPDLELALIVAGMHLSREFGYTIQEIERDGFRVDAKVDMLLSDDTGARMAQSLGVGLIEFTQVLEATKPDIMVVEGDREDPFAAAIAAFCLDIPVAHIAGGDVAASGHIDEAMRHSITKFAHIHFPTTAKSAERIIKMGEDPWRIHVVGPLGIYAMPETKFIPREELCQNSGFDADRNLILTVQHSATTQAEKAPEQIRETMEALAELGEQTAVIYPNADAGSRAMIEIIGEYKGYPHIKIFKNLPYLTFVSLMKASDVIIGNSSAAITEAPLFGLPVVNIGIRQKGRERGANIFDVPQ